jgi:hypothetical protein
MDSLGSPFMNAKKPSLQDEIPFFLFFLQASTIMIGFKKVETMTTP